MASVAPREGFTAPPRRPVAGEASSDTAAKLQGLTPAAMLPPFPNIREGIPHHESQCKMDRWSPVRDRIRQRP
ncbi:hypothetical protein DU490_07410 [Halomonas sp. DQ26W]|nr:hypothetical protein DU490_07410 [Halomonas sp. DQ26W]